MFENNPGSYLGQRALIISLLLMLGASAASAQTTGFTYQGKLTDGGAPANGNYDLQFTLWDAASGGTQQPQPSPVTVTLASVSVSAGIFTVQVDFGANGLPGADRFLEISARLAGGGMFTTLSPRQQLTSTPYAVRSSSAASADTATNAAQLGGVAASQYVLTTDSRLSDARPPTPGSPNYIRNTTGPQAGANFNISGNGTIGGALTANGNVGIGTTAPLSQLHVAGTSPVRILGDTSTLSGSEYVDFFARTSQFNNDIGGIRIQRNSSTGDVDTQLFAAAAGNAAAEKVRIAGNGRVGIGTSTPKFGLDVEQPTGNTDAKFGSIFGLYAVEAGPALGFNAYYNSAWRFGKGSTNNFGGIIDLSPGDGSMVFRTTNSGAADAAAVVTERMRITPSGFVGIGTTNPQYTLHVDGGSGTGVYGNSSGSSSGISAGYGVYGNNSGNGFGVYGTSFSGAGVFGKSTGPGYAGAFNGNVLVSGDLTVDGTFSNPSDIRLKHDIADLNYGLLEIMQLRPVTWTWKQQPERGVQLGLIAQELEPILPELVTTAKDAEQTKGINYIGLVPVVIKAIQEQQATIATLKAENAELKQQSATAQRELKQQQSQIESLKKLVCRRHRNARACK